MPTTTAAPPTLWRTALRALYGLLLLSLAARVVFTLWEPPFDGSVHYDDITGAYWPMNLYLGGPAYLVSFLTMAVFVALLARGRTAPLTLAAATLVALGGTVFSLAITAEALPFAYAADRSLIGEPEGRALVDTYNANLDRLLPAIIGGTLAIALGIATTLATSWVTGALPRRFVLAAALYLAVYLALPPDLPRPVAALSYLLEVTLLATLAWHSLRADR